MHDPVIGGYPLHWCPVYFGHGSGPEGKQYMQAQGYDSVWAFELMWMSMEDLLSGRAIALYYYNLAYNLPLYIHIDLRTDNANALVFWWNASTCRHLGIGGTHQDPQVRRAHKEAVVTYQRLSAFFKAGKFYGIDETIHVHVHPTEQAAVVNYFNMVLHGDEVLALVLADLVDCADVGMVQCRSSLGLMLKPFKGMAVLGYCLGQELEGNEAAQGGVFHLVDDANPTTAQFLNDPVMRNRLADFGHAGLRYGESGCRALWCPYYGSVGLFQRGSEERMVGHTSACGIASIPSRNNRRLDDIFEVQEEVACQISEKLRPRLTPDERKRRSKRHIFPAVRH